MPRVYWKPVLAVFAIAVGVRGALNLRQAEDKAAPVTLTHPDETETDETDEPAAATAAGGESTNETPKVRGALTFDHDPVEVKPKPEDDEIATTFEFTNTSDKPVTVTGLESTCSCLEASMDQRTYAPGARGSGKALFKVSSFVGRHEKTLHIYTDYPGATEQVLTFALEVPVVVSIEPNLLEWTLGEPAQSKTMVIKMVGQDPLHITHITPTRENVRYELKEVSPGREYHLIVTPTTTADITIGAFKIETDSKIPKYARQMAFFSIERPDLAEKKKAAAAAAKEKGNQ